MEEKRLHFKAWLQAKKKRKYKREQLAPASASRWQGNRRNLDLMTSKPPISQKHCLKLALKQPHYTLSICASHDALSSSTSESQEEIGRIVGHERMSNMNDEPKIQYIKGMALPSL